ncbi:MAG: hypothetical protein WCI73_18160, partial [Phycisphaerae bacterium]
MPRCSSPKSSLTTATPTWHAPAAKRRLAHALVCSAVLLVTQQVWAWDVSPAPFLQYFESTSSTIENRVPDIFNSGYGALWTPPPARAEQGNLSVGYDPY